MIPRLARRLGGSEAPPPAPVGQVIALDYPVTPRRRTTFHPHPGLKRIVAARRDRYAEVLRTIVELREDFARIASTPTELEPGWANGWLSPFDAAALYAFMVTENPARYVEIGSGNSTKFVRRAIRDHGLRTTVVSIDPHPRDEVDQLCDTVVRQGLEDTDLSAFEGLQAGDVVFLDGSHRVFTNADTTVALLEVLPMVPPGALFHVHDVFLPFDYPEEWYDRWYAEGYLLAAWLLAEGPHLTVHLPSHWVTLEPDLFGILAPLWELPALADAERCGQSFWLRR